MVELLSLPTASAAQLKDVVETVKVEPYGSTGASIKVKRAQGVVSVDSHNANLVLGNHGSSHFHGQVDRDGRQRAHEADRDSLHGGRRQVMKSPHGRGAGSGFSVVELSISLTTLAIVLGAIVTATTTFTNVFSSSQNYSVGQLSAADFLTLDLRRASSYSFTKSGNKLTLPLNLTLPKFHAADGRTPDAPERTKVTTTNKKSTKKKHKIVEARYYYHYNNLGDSIAVQYYLANGALFRKEGTRPARQVAERVRDVTFSATPSPNVTPAADRCLHGRPNAGGHRCQPDGQHPD